MAGELDTLEASVTRSKTVEGSAITLMQGLKGALDAAIASGDMTRVQAISDGIGANTDALAAAVVANTPAAP